MRTSRLTPEHWLTAGFDALKRLGPAALAAEPLARHLGTTKGSFYWHFKDVPAFHAALVASWRDTTITQMMTQLEQSGSADQRLRVFGAQLLDNPIEPRLRIWAQTSAEVAKALQEVDNQRLSYITTLLRGLGLGNTDFARALLATLVGLPQIAPNDRAQQKATFDTLIDTVLALS